MTIDSTSLFGIIALSSILALSVFSTSLTDVSAQTVQAVGDFYCWNIVTVPASISTNVVDLTDQFRQYNNLDTFTALQFCDSADKDREPFDPQNPDFLSPYSAQHYTTYFIPPSFDPPNQVDLGVPQFNVVYENLDIGVVKEVWVPNTKILESTGPEDSENLDLHYVCYEITEASLDVTIQMETQFGPIQLIVRDPILLCNPALKEHNGQQLNINFASVREHFTCYNVEPVPGDPDAMPLAIPEIPVPDLNYVIDQLTNDNVLNGMLQVVQITDHKACFESQKTDEGVAGTFVPINYSMLILAGTQMVGAWIIPALVASAGIAIVIARKY